MRKLLSLENGRIYKLQYENIVEHDNIEDSYILWEVWLDSDEECEHFSITHYYYVESLEECLKSYDYEIIKD